MIFIPLISLPVFSGRGEFTQVKGIGYPPIRAQSPAQARLLARRSAILDAYRNALGIAGNGGEYDERAFYLHFGGFIQGARIIKEEFLEDGGIMVTLEIDEMELAGMAKKIKTGVNEPPMGPSGAVGKPARVSISEWQKVVAKFVTYVNRNTEGGAE